MRITVAGEKIFPIAIDSQSDEKTKVDWRRDQSRAMYSSKDISESLSSKLREYMKRTSLVYGAFDFVVTPDDQAVFLECNPSGQWLWLEKATNLPISEAIAHLLADPSRAA